MRHFQKKDQISKYKKRTLNKFKNLKISLLILLFLKNCSFAQDYQTLNSPENKNANNRQNLIIELNNFDDFPLTINVHIMNTKNLDGKNNVCGDLISKYQIKYDKKPIIINLNNEKYCIDFFFHYSTFRPFQKNYKAALSLHFNTNSSCLEQPRLAVQYIHTYNCPILDFQNSSRKIILTNVSKEKIDEHLAIISWGGTIMTATRPPPLLYLTPFYFFFGGYVTVINKIEFEII